MAKERQLCWLIMILYFMLKKKAFVHLRAEQILVPLNALPTVGQTVTRNFNFIFQVTTKDIKGSRVSWMLVCWGAMKATRGPRCVWKAARSFDRGCRRPTRTCPHLPCPSQHTCTHSKSLYQKTCVCTCGGPTAESVSSACDSEKFPPSLSSDDDDDDDDD